MKTKPFDFTKMLAGKPIILGNGAEAKFGCVSPDNETYVIWYKRSIAYNYKWESLIYQLGGSGRYSPWTTGPGDLDIFLKRETTTVFIGVFKWGCSITTQTFNTLDELETYHKDSARYFTLLEIIEREYESI